MKRAVFAVLALGLVCGVGARLSAHHSFAAHYDTNTPIEVTGAIANVQLTNPHSWFFLDVKEPNGTVTKWKFEAGTPSGMIRNGYKASELPAGTVVTITGFPSRASEHVGMLRELKTADGKTYGMFGPQQGAGAR